MTGVIFLASMSSFNTTIDLRGPSCLGRDAGSSRRVTPRSVWRSDPGFRTNDDPNCRTGRIQHVCPIGFERTLAFGPPAVPRQIQDEVVALGTAREVLLRVVDDAVHADRAQHVELRGSIHTGHFRSKRLGELKCERPHGATRAVDETFCPGWVRPSSRTPWTASDPEVGTAAACSNVIPAGFGSRLYSGMAANSAKAPPWRHRFPTKL